MILVVTSSAREREALAALGAARGWNLAACATLAEAWQRVRRAPPRVVLMRHQLEDGYGEELLRRGTAEGLAVAFVLLHGADLPAAALKRYITGGCTCLLRDPVRSDVLATYLERLRAPAAAPAARPPRPPRRERVAGAVFDPGDRTLARGRRRVRLTPREAALLAQLCARRGQVATYEQLYQDLLDRRFTGDTSNLRVLLGKLAASFTRLGCDLRAACEVIPKAGYRLRAARRRAR